ncbi:MAG: hypothetical protein HY904_20230 [Deltaproteobacteria bacterium]|nr:hypothetical protein [Deltaproteobacteria bacterium]
MPAAVPPAVEAWHARGLGVAAAAAPRAAVEAWVTAEPRNPEALSLLAEAHYWTGLQLADERAPEAQARAAYGRGMDAARRAQAAAPQHPGGWFWETVNLAKQAEIDGIIRSASLLPTLRRLMDRAGALSPCYFHGGVNRFWAAVVIRTPEFLVRLQGRSSSKDGEEQLRTADRCAPDFLGNARFRAELRVKEDRKADALALLRAALARPPSADPAVEAWNRHERVLTRQMLARLGARE